MKRAQIKMFETIGVLIVFFFLLISGTVFYFNLQESSLRKELAQQAQLRSLQAAQRATFLPELDCSFASVTRENCFDIYKLAAFAQVRDRYQSAYFGLFGYATVTVRQAYPAADFTTVLYDNPPEEYSRSLKSFSPVLLYDAATRDAAFGVMEVVTYASR